MEPLAGSFDFQAGQGSLGGWGEERMACRSAAEHMALQTEVGFWYVQLKGLRQLVLGKTFDSAREESLLTTLS